MEELWKDVDGCPGYQASNMGRLRTRRIRGGGKGNFCRLGDEWKELKSTVCGTGRRIVAVRDAYGHPRLANVAVLVLESFVGLRPAGMFACHKDDNKLDDRLENLYWGTPSQNNMDAIANGKTPLGQACHLAKMSNETALSIKADIAAGIRGSVIAKKHNVMPSIVSKIKRGHAWRHV